MYRQVLSYIVFALVSWIVIGTVFNVINLLVILGSLSIKYILGIHLTINANFVLKMILIHTALPFLYFVDFILD